MHALTAHLENGSLGRSSPELRSAWPVALPRSPTTAVLVWGVGTAEIGIANGIVTMVGIGIGIVIAIALDLEVGIGL